mgnify:CR=1 FL=1
MIQHFLDYIAVEKKYSERTVGAYRDDLRAFCQFLGWELGDYDPSRVKEEDIRDWMISLLDAGQSPRSVKRYLSALRSFYKFMLRVGLVKVDVTRRIIAPKTPKTLPVFFNPSEMERALEHEDNADDFESVRNNLIIEMLYQTGMRQAELIGLKDADVDLEQRQVRIFGKRKKERIVPIGDALVQLIQTYLQYRQEVGQADTFFVIPLRRGGAKPLNSTHLYKVVHERMGEVTTRKKRSPHVLRHTFATTMLNNGADIRTIQSLLGHASLAATQIYTHASFDQIKNVYNQAHPRAKRKE